MEETDDHEKVADKSRKRGERRAEKKRVQAIIRARYDKWLKGYQAYGWRIGTEERFAAYKDRMLRLFRKDEGKHYSPYTCPEGHGCNYCASGRMAKFKRANASLDAQLVFLENWENEDEIP